MIGCFLALALTVSGVGAFQGEDMSDSDFKLYVKTHQKFGEKLGCAAGAALKNGGDQYSMTDADFRRYVKVHGMLGAKFIDLLDAHGISAVAGVVAAAVTVGTTKAMVTGGIAGAIKSYLEKTLNGYKERVKGIMQRKGKTQTWYDEKIRIWKNTPWRYIDAGIECENDTGGLNIACMKKALAAKGIGE